LVKPTLIFEFLFLVSIARKAYNISFLSVKEI